MMKLIWWPVKWLILFKIPRKIADWDLKILNPIWRDLYNADNMPIDLIISPELEVAKSIERQLKAPGHTM